MKGRIDVESEPGHGSTFTVHLPAEVTAEAEVIQAHGDNSDRAPLRTASDDTVLVIDDDPAVRDLMSRFLTRLGVTVVPASTAEEGIRLAREVRPLLIILDVVLPDFDGWTVLQTIKADPELTNIPVIVLTMVDNQAMAINLGACDYLLKPVDRERITDLVERHRVTNAASSMKRTTDYVPLAPIKDATVSAEVIGRS
jgi:DNA-binding response OmpR family regulator